MSRICLAVVLLAVASLTGCAICDTCDDFPTPCIGPNCGGQGQYTGGGPTEMMPLAGPVNPQADAAEMARDLADPDPGHADPAHAHLDGHPAPAYASRRPLIRLERPTRRPGRSDSSASNPAQSPDRSKIDRGLADLRPMV